MSGLLYVVAALGAVLFGGHKVATATAPAPPPPQSFIIMAAAGTTINVVGAANGAVVVQVKPVGGGQEAITVTPQPAPVVAATPVPSPVSAPGIAVK